MKKLKKFIEQTIKKKSKTVTMPTQEQLEAISRLSFNKPFYWSLFVELYQVQEKKRVSELLEAIKKHTKIVVE